MEEASSIGLTVVTVTDCRVEDLESGKYQLIFASALVKPFFLLMKKSHIISPEYAGLHQTYYGVKPSSAVVSVLSIV